jgi:hypothetical protein
MKLYIIKAWNSFGGGIGTYHVIASGVNAAKRAVKEADHIVKRCECIEVHPILMAK